MKKVLLFCLLSIVLLAPLSLRAIEWADGSLDVQYGISTYYEHIDGNRGLANPPLDVNLRTNDNWHYRENLKVALEQKLRNRYTFSFVFDGFYTTEKNEWLLKKNERWQYNDIRLNLSGKNFRLSLGTLTESSEVYTFNRSFKGISLWYQPFSVISISAFAGLNVEEDNYEYAFGGTRILLKPSQVLTIGTSFIHSEATWLSPTSYETDFANDALSFEVNLNNYRLFGNSLTIDAKAALSWYINDRQDSLSEVVQGWALDVNAGYRMKNGLTVNMRYLYIDPLFTSRLGTAEASDTEKISGRLSFREGDPSSLLRFFVEHTFYHDCLTDGTTKAFRTNWHQTRAVVGITPLINKRFCHFKNLKLYSELYYNNNQSENSPKTIDTEQFIYIFAVSNTFRKMNYHLTYKFDYFNDLSHDGTDTMQNIIEVHWDYQFDRFRLRWKPRITYSINLTDTFLRNPDETRYDARSSIIVGLDLIYPPTDTRLTMQYNRDITEPSSGIGTRHNKMVITLTHPFTIRNEYPCSVTITYTNIDHWSLKREQRWGEDVWKTNFTVRF